MNNESQGIQVIPGNGSPAPRPSCESHSAYSGGEGSRIRRTAFPVWIDWGSGASQRALRREMKKTDFRQVTVWLPWRGQFRFVNSQKIRIRDAARAVECITGTFAGGLVEMDHVMVALVGKVVHDLVAITGLVVAIVRRPAEEVEVIPVAEGCVMDPVDASGMMVRIES